MYKSFYGLKEKPFSLLPDPAYLYLSKQHEMAMTLLEYSLENQAGFCVISGKAGTGKTTLVRRLLNQIGNDVSIGLISNTHHSFGELLRWILQAFSLEDTGKTRAQLHQVFVDYLIGQYAKNRRTMLIIDEAQNMSPDALEELRMLSNINSEKDLLLQVILVGQSPLRDILRRPELEQFAQRIAVDYHLESLSRQETQGYIRHRIMVAGGEHELFTKDACDAVFEGCGGIPRLINLLCDYSLVYAYASQAAVVTGELVEEVVREREKYGALPVFAVTTEEHAKRSLPAKGKRPPPAAKLPVASAAHTTRKMGASTIMPDVRSTKPAEGSGKNVAALAPGAVHESRIETKARTDEMDVNLATAPEVSRMNNAGTLTASRDRAVTPLKNAASYNIPGRIEPESLPLQAVSKEQLKTQKPDNLPDESSLSEKNWQEKTIASKPDISGTANHAKLSNAEIVKRSNVDGGFAERNRMPLAKRIIPFAVFGVVLLSIVLIWFFANLPSRPLQAASNKIASPPVVAVAPAANVTTVTDVKPVKAVPVNDRIPDAQPLERISPISREDTKNAVVETDPQQEARLKSIQRERDSALALAKAAKREAMRNVAQARERALAAEREMALARERESANQLALTAERERENAKQLALAAEKARHEARAVEAAAAVREIKPEPVSTAQSRTAVETGVAKPVGFAMASKAAGSEGGNDENDNDLTTFTANPCKGPSARFLSTCE